MSLLISFALLRVRIKNKYLLLVLVQRSVVFHWNPTLAPRFYEIFLCEESKLKKKRWFELFLFCVDFLTGKKKTLSLELYNKNRTMT